MNKEVLIRIKAGISSENDSEEIVTKAKGSYFKKQDCEYVLYDEETDDGQIVKCRLKITDSELEMRKTGAYTAVMVFTRDKKTNTGYRTPFGILDMEINTTKLDYYISQDEMKIKLEYSLSVNNAEASMHVMDIQIGNE